MYALEMPQISRSYKAVQTRKNAKACVENASLISAITYKSVVFAGQFSDEKWVLLKRRCVGVFGTVYRRISV